MNVVQFIRPTKNWCNETILFIEEEYLNIKCLIHQFLRSLTIRLVVLSSQQHCLRILHKLLEVLKQLGTHRTVHNPVVAGQGDPHDAGHGRGPTSTSYNLLLCSTYSQAFGLGYSIGRYFF